MTSPSASSRLLHRCSLASRRSRPARSKTSSKLQPDTGNVHTPTITIKNAALLALIGTILATVLLVWTFTFNFINVLRGLAPPVLLFPWFIYAFACFSVAVFFYVFYKAQA